MGEGESSDPESLESSKHPQAGTNGVARFHGDNAGYLAVLMRINQLCKKKHNYFKNSFLETFCNQLLCSFGIIKKCMLNKIFNILHNL